MPTATLSDRRRFTPIDEVEDAVPASRFTPIDEVPDDPEDFARQHPLASNRLWETLVSRPAAQYRSAVRGAMTGKNPLEEFKAGAMAQGEELVNRARPFDIRNRIVNAVTNRFPPARNPLEIAGQTVAGTVASGVGMVAEAGVNAATNPIEALGFLLPLSRGGRRVGEAISASRPGQAVGKVLQTDVKDVGRGITSIFKGKPPVQMADLLKLSEAQVAKLPDLQRSSYLQAKRLEESQVLARQRQAVAKQYQVAVNDIKTQQTALGRSAPSVAAQRLEKLRAPFRQLMKDQGDVYTTGINDAIANAEAATGEPLAFTRNEINQEIANKYLRPTTAGTPAIPQEDVTQYRALADRLGRHLEGRTLLTHPDVSMRPTLDPQAVSAR